MTIITADRYCMGQKTNSAILVLSNSTGKFKMLQWHKAINNGKPQLTTQTKTNEHTAYGTMSMKNILVRGRSIAHKFHIRKTASSLLSNSFWHSGDTGRESAQFTVQETT